MAQRAIPACLDATVIQDRPAIQALLRPFPAQKGDTGMPGRDGRDGRDGLPGNRGERGERGDTGHASTVPGPPGQSIIGPPGRDGVDGATGPTGKASTVAGPQGPRGDTGQPGRDGRDGLPGRDGRDGFGGGAGFPTGPTGPAGSGASFEILSASGTQVVDFVDGALLVRAVTGSTNISVEATGAFVAFSLTGPQPPDWKRTDAAGRSSSSSRRRQCVRRSRVDRIDQCFGRRNGRRGGVLAHRAAAS